MWLGGSLGRGVADAGSDLDVVVAIAAGSFDGFAAGWRDWLAAITPTVLARELPRLPGSFYSVTPECLRLDVVAEPPAPRARLPWPAGSWCWPRMTSLPAGWRPEGRRQTAAGPIRPG